MIEELKFEDQPHYKYQIYKQVSRTDAIKIQAKNAIESLHLHQKSPFIFSYYNFEGKQSIYKRIKQFIEAAIEENSYILVCSYYINSYEIFQLLIQAAAVLNGKVYVLISKSDSSMVSHDQNGKLASLNIIDLEKKGVLIRRKDNAHLKFLVAGNRSILFTTNLSSEGLFYNPEFGLAFEDDMVIHEGLKSVFKKLWFEKSDEMLYNNNWIPAIHWQPKNSFKNQKNLQTSLCNPLYITSSPLLQELNSEKEILSLETLFDVLKSQLNVAQHSIKISIFSFYPDKYINEIVEILKGKLKKKILVQILVPEVQVKRRPLMEKLLKELSKMGGKIRYYREIHGKTIIVDDNIATIFTGNFDKFLTNTGSADLGLSSTHPSIIHNLVKLYNHLWEEASESPYEHSLLRLKLDLNILSENQLLPGWNLSVVRLRNIITKSKEIQLIEYNDNYILNIHQDRLKPILLSLDTINMFEEGDIFNIEAILVDKPLFDKKHGEIFKIQDLQLNLYWKIN